MKTAVVLFAYKRPEYLKKALASHTRVDSLDYYAFVDYSEIQDEILDIILQKGLYTVYAEEKNLGLNKNIITGISVLFRSYDAVIVLEDDIVLRGDALIFLKTYLELLKDVKHIGAVSCKKEPGFLHKGFYCWGWGTWKDRWNETVKALEINGKSWDIQVFDYFIQNNLYTYCSPIKRSKHIGNKGTHYKWYSKLSVRRVWARLVHSFSF